MSDMIEGNGSCLCGATKIKATKINKQVGACHFGMCRKRGGGPLLVVDCGEDVSFEGEENTSVFSSSEWAERGFCNKCGAVSCPLLPFRQARKMGAFGQGDMHWSTN